MQNLTYPDEISPVGAKNFIRNRPSLSLEYYVPSEKHGFYTFVVNLTVGDLSGKCCLKEIDIGLLETHCRLDDDLCGQGFGTMMYSAAIRIAKEMGFRVCSSRHVDMTRGARILWASRGLNKEFRIYRDHDRYRVL